MSARARKFESEKRPTLRTIASEARLSHATVSLALRNHPSIPAPTRLKIQRIAKKLAYRPDPEVAKLMHHLRQNHKVRFKSTIAALTTIPENREPVYATALREGAEAAADLLGYGFTVFRIEASPKRNTSLQRMLRGRGMEGVLLLPMKDPLPLSDLLDWNCFSVIAATYGVLAPDFHRVLPDQFGNNLLLCQELAGLRKRRIGLVIDRTTDLAVGHRFSAPAVWQGTMGGTEHVAPFVHPRNDRAGLREWFERERPDAIIAGHDGDVREIARALKLRLPGRVAFAVTEHPNGARFGGIDQRAREIGRAAVAQLHARLQRGEKGVPEIPSVTMIRGRWVPAGAQP